MKKKFLLDSPKKTVADSTAKQYMSKLNNLAKFGYTTPIDLYEMPEQVIEQINELTKDRRQLCLYYSAIFYAIGEQDFKKNPDTKLYYDAFRKTYYTEDYPSPSR